MKAKLSDIANARLFLIDIGGTLSASVIDDRFHAHAEAVSCTFPGFEKQIGGATKKFLESRQYRDFVKSRDKNWGNILREFRKEISHHANVDYSKENLKIIDAHDSIIRGERLNFYPGAIKFLETMQTNYALVTNGGGDYMEIVAENLPYRPVFIASAEEQGVRKASGGLYKIAITESCGRLGVPESGIASNCVMFDNNPKNGLASERLGIPYVIIEGNETWSNLVDELEEYMARETEELEASLKINNLLFLE